MNQFLVAATGEVLELGEKIAGFLDELSTSTQIDALISAVNAKESLPDVIRNQLPAGLTESSLLEFLEMVRDQASDLEDSFATRRANLGAELRKYFRTIDDLPVEGAIWGWSLEENAPPSPAGSLTFTLGAEVEVSCGIHKPGPVYRLAGSLGVSGSAVAPFSFGSASVRASAKRGATFEAAFAHSGNTRVIEAAVMDLEILGQLNSPSVLAGAPHFQSVGLTLTGDVKLGVSLQAGKSWVHARQFGAAAVTAEVSLGARLDLEWTMQGDYTLTVERSGAGVLRVTLEDRQLTTSSRALSLGATVNVRNLDQAVKPVLDRIAALPDPVEKLVDKYSQPSALLGDLLNSSLAAVPDEVQQLADSIMGEGSAERFINELVEGVLNSAEEKTAHFGGLLQGVAVDLVDDTVARLSILDDDQADSVRGLLLERLTDVSAKLQTDVLKTIRGLISDTAARDALVSAISDIGTNVHNTLTDVDALAGNLLEPVKKLLEAYRGAQEKIGDAIMAIERENLTITLGHAVNRANDRRQFLAFEIVAFSPATVNVYRQMLRGDFSAALAQAMSTSNPDIRLTESIFEQVITRRKSTALNINLFGVKLSWQQMLTDRLEVTANGGKIDVLIGSGAIEEQVIAFDESQSFRVDSTVNFIAQTATVNLIAKYADNDPSLKELLEYIAALEAAHLVPEGAASRLLTSEDLIRAVAANSAIQINTIVSLTRQQLDDLAGLKKRRVRTIAILNQVTALRHVPTLAAALDKLKARSHAATAAGVIFALRNRGRKFIVSSLGGTPGAVLSDPVKARQLMMIMNSNQNAEALFAFLQAWQVFSRSPHPRLEENHVVNQNDVQRLEKANREIVEIIDEWVEVPGILRKAFTNRMSPWTIALFATVNELLREVGNDGDRFVVPVVSWKENARTRHLGVV